MAMYIYNIWEKKLEMKCFFCMHINIKVSYKLALLFLMEVASHIQSTQNRKLETFLRYIKQKVSQLFLCSLVIQNMEIFYESSVFWISFTSVSFLTVYLLF